MEATLEAVRRERFGKNEAGRLRREGMIPAVLYGEARKTESIAVDPKALLRILRSASGANTLIALKLAGTSDDTRVLVKEYQYHPVDHDLLHADFYTIAMDKVLRVTVPVHLTGEAKGVKVDGGVVDFVHRDIVIECLPADIPGHITVDVTELGLHDGIRVRDLDTGGKWKALSDADMLIVHVIAPKAEEVAATADAAAPVLAAEPELIKKGKKDEADEKDDKKKDDKKK